MGWDGTSGVFRGPLRLPLWYEEKIDVFTNKHVIFVNFPEYILKIALSRSIFQPKMHNSVWQPGSARTRWGAYSAPQIP